MMSYKFVDAVLSGLIKFRLQHEAMYTDLRFSVDKILYDVGEKLVIVTEKRTNHKSL